MPKKRYNITFSIEKLSAHVYIKAQSIKQISHERIEADGVVIDLPGNITGIGCCFWSISDKLGPLTKKLPGGMTTQGV
jgi:hypothetical protein